VCQKSNLESFNTIATQEKAISIKHNISPVSRGKGKLNNLFDFIQILIC